MGMDPRTELDAETRAVVRQAVDMVVQMRPEWGDGDRLQHLHQDMAFHCVFALAAERLAAPSIFDDYIAWALDVLAARGVPREPLLIGLGTLADYWTGGPAAMVRDTMKRLERGALRPRPMHLDARVEPLADLLIAGDLGGAMTWLDGQGVEPRDAIDRYLAPAMRHIGEGWLLADLSVAQEHVASATARDIVARLQSVRRRRPATGRKALIACVEGNQHDLGARAVAAALTDAGWTTTFIPADTPVLSLLDMARVLRPDMIGLAAALPHHIYTARRTIAALRGAPELASCRFVVGGPAFTNTGELWKATGADAVGLQAADVLQD